jgi:ADP-ribosylglycohydrolase
VLGTLIGDIIGSIYEFNNHRSKEFPFFGNDVEFTDDSVCTIALASAILSQSAPTPVLQDWCRRYPGRGYGGMFNRWINNPEPLPYNSYGNGAAMRVSSAAWLGGSLEDALALSDHITQITHNHAEGMKGARATCHAIHMVLHGMSADQIRSTVQATSEYDLSQSVDEIRPAYYFNETCQETVPQAIICALNADSFEDAIRNAISIGGDSDTVAAIAGSIAEPLFGIPEEIASQALDYPPVSD